MSQRSPGVIGAGGLLDQQPGRLDAGRHVGELDLDRLVAGDRLAEGLALLGVAERVFERGAGNADAAGRNIDPAELEPAERVAQPLAFFQPDQPAGRDAVVLEDQFG